MPRPLWSRVASDYSMVLALLALCAYFAYVTLAEQHTEGAAGGEALAGDIVQRFGAGAKVVVVVGQACEDASFADALRQSLEAQGAKVLARAEGDPRTVRLALEEIGQGSDRPDAIAACRRAGRWSLLEHLDSKVPALGTVPVVVPRGYVWPNFLQTSNLLNIANQIAIIAIIAVGMTMVIITGGIDLSVGSLIALSAVTATLLIRDAAGAEAASPRGMIACSLAAIVLCGLVGLVNGVLITTFTLPPFIVTLAMMLVVRGLAFKIARDQSIYQVPDSFVWLGRGADLMNVPNAVFLMGVLYVIAHVVMTRMTLGRYLYAVGGNAEAARLSGVPVKRILLFAYVVSAALAGLGGVIMASQLKSGSPTYGPMYELYVIAAVVVGGTSLSGGDGRIFGTLVGVLLIAVIQNGMNLTGVESHTQPMVLGLVLLGAVLLDQVKRWELGRLIGRRRPV